MGFAFRDIISFKRQKHNLSLQQVWHMVIYCCFAGWAICWIKYFTGFSRLYSFDSVPDHEVMYFQECYVKMYRFGSLWMVRVSLLPVSQCFPCKQGHCGNAHSKKEKF